MKIIVVQSTPNALNVAKQAIEKAFPNLNNVVYNSNFESTLKLIPKNEDVVVITSNMFHDDRDILLPSYEKDGNKLSEMVKQINKKAKVYLYSTGTSDKNNFIDFWFQKSGDGGNVRQELVGIFIYLGLV